VLTLGKKLWSSSEFPGLEFDASEVENSEEVSLESRNSEVALKSFKNVLLEFDASTDHSKKVVLKFDASLIQASMKLPQACMNQSQISSFQVHSKPTSFKTNSTRSQNTSDSSNSFC
jgi:hypothetical protein